MSGPARPVRYVQSERVLSRRTLHGILVLPIDHGEFFDLTGTGEVLWDVLAEPRSIAEAASALHVRFEGPLADVVADVTPVVADLVRRRALVRSDGPGP